MNARSRIYRRRSRSWILLLVLVVGVLARYGYDRWHGAPPLGGMPPLEEGVYEVVRVVDGDTLIVRKPDAAEALLRSSRGVRLRLLGIDCPELERPDHPAEPWSAEATEFTERFVAGRPVRLEFDRRRIDRYNRYLAYVFVGDRMLNEALVEAGLARVSTFPGDSESIARRLRKAEQQAREARRGIWSVAHSPGADTAKQHIQGDAPPVGAPAELGLVSSFPSLFPRFRAGTPLGDALRSQLVAAVRTRLGARVIDDCAVRRKRGASRRCRGPVSESW